MMHITKSILTLVLFSLFGTTQAQYYNWENNPAPQTLPDSLKQESAVILLEKRQIQYVPDAKKDEIAMYKTVHRRVKLVDDKGIEMFNSSTIGSAPGSSVDAIKARTIKANGKIIVLQKEQIKTNKDEFGQTQYHIAFEGLEHNDEVELFYTEKRPYQIFGSEIMQFTIPILKTVFVLESPDFLVFETKGYNGYPATIDSIIGKWRTYTSELDGTAALEEEPYSDLRPNLKRMEYKISYSGSSEARRYTWNELADRLYDIYYSFNDKELKAVDKFIAPLQLKGKTEEQKITLIEELIKRDIVFENNLKQQEYDLVNYVIEKKTANETGLVRLFTAALKQAGVQNELGCTSNRFDFPLDEQFENWNRPDLYLIYFPQTGKYLCPTAITMRYPTIPSIARGNKAVFSSKDAFTGSVIRKISATTVQESSNYLKAEVSFNSQDLTPEILLTQTFKGYAAVGLREAAIYTPKDKEKDLVLNLTLGIADQPEDLLKYSFNNVGLQHYSDGKPLEIVTEIKATQLMETAGDKWLFKLGDVIGPQSQLYNEKTRKLPISMPYAHDLVRDIIVNIPKGYKISNPDAVKLNVIDAEKVSGFESSYTLNSDQMIIHINEYYSKDNLPVEDYNSFRNVINAAADFNKVTLVLEKK